jgi:glycosyltransferase involved in cell wall biosynthesis
MDKTKILFDAKAFEMQRYGGISRYFCEIIRRLNVDYDIAERFSINYYLTSYHLSKRHIPLPRGIYKHYREQCIQSNERLTRKLLQSNCFQLFHPTYYDTGVLSHLRNIPYVLTVHDMTHERLSDSFAAIEDIKQTIAVKTEAIRHADHLIAISEHTKKDLMELLHIPEEKIDVVYHSTNMQPPKGQLRMKLPERYILYVGDRAPYKNFDRYAEVCSRLHREDKGLYFVCTGKKFSSQELEQLNRLGIAHRVMHIYASDRELAELYHRATLFVYPSRYEGFGIPILEAYSCQCPVVLSRASCFPEIAGEAGEYFDPLSTDDMLDAIRRVLYQPKRRAALRALGSERLKRFSWEKAARETEAVYQKVISKHQS